MKNEENIKISENFYKSETLILDIKEDIPYWPQFCNYIKINKKLEDNLKIINELKKIIVRK